MFSLIFAFFIYHFVVIATHLETEVVFGSHDIASKTEISAMPLVKNVKVVNKPKDVQPEIIIGNFTNGILGKYDFLFSVFGTREFGIWSNNATAGLFGEILAHWHVVRNWGNEKCHVVFEHYISCGAIPGIFEFDNYRGRFSHLETILSGDTGCIQPWTRAILHLVSHDSELIYSGESQDGSEHDQGEGENEFYLFIERQFLPFSKAVVFVSLQIISAALAVTLPVFGSKRRDLLLGFFCLVLNFVFAHLWLSAILRI